MNFEDLGLSPEVLRAVTECGYTIPTPIQEKAIPAILMTRDVLGLAQTGTGKTASFILPMIEILAGGRAKARMPRSLVLEPTRELAAQVAQNFDQYGKYNKLNKALLVGGESLGEQMKILDKGADVLIATPGRLLDLFERGSILLNDIKILVIDEADRMLDMGFIPDIERIISLVPPIRQTLLFSATMPKEIKGLADKLLSNPKEISVAAPSSPAVTVEQFLVWTKRDQKREVLDRIIRQENVKNAFIFCNRKRDIDGLTRWLSGRGYKAAAMHGDMPQTKRYETLDRFKAGEIVLLVCSDVAARGLDVAGLSHVFNFDVPMAADDYVHRIGRTGRAGLQGRAWMLAASGPEDKKFVDAIERLIARAIPIGAVGGTGARSEGAEAGQKPEPVREDRPKRADAQRERTGGHDRRPPRGERPVRESRPPREGPRREPVREMQDHGATVTGFGDDVPDFFGR